jgi:hypothetical protein
MFLCTQTAWRRERDSNPRYGFPYSGFQDRPFQPLTHPSNLLTNNKLVTSTFVSPHGIALLLRMTVGRVIR